MKRLILMGALAALAVPFVPTVADAGGKPVPMCDGLEATIVGTNAHDIIEGTDGPDVIVGLNGNDYIDGNGGDDVICGGPGDDNIEGQGGDDRLFGGPGDDWMDGGEGGCCRFDTNTGDDWLYGGPGADELHTSDFPTLGNHLFGEEGPDELFVWSGGWGDGGTGDDTIHQYGGDAWLYGGHGDDFIENWNNPGTEDVDMFGGTGDDELVNHDLSGTTDMDGEQGFDTCTDGTTEVSCEA